MQTSLAGVYAIVTRIPEGTVTTYGAIGRVIAVPRGARGVGWAMAHCPPMIPWWRVVAKNGRITSPDAILQEALLRSEGVPMQAAGLVRIHDAFWLPVLD